MKLLIKFPTRSRPEKFFEVLNLYCQKAKDLSKISFLISCDHDDASMNNPEIISKMEKAKKKINLNYFFGNSKTKIEAVNADMEKVDGWDIVLLASDDMIPITYGYDEIIREDMNLHYRNTDGVLWYNDGGQNKINTLCVLGKKYYDRFNYIYHPDYISLWCDNEFTDVSILLQRCFKSDKIIIEHAHPVYEKTNYDALYAKNESYFESDKKIYMHRQKNNFDLKQIFPLLSILTPSVPSRINSNLLKLMEKIDKQIKENNLERKVEHLVHIDNKIRTIGRKRDNLVQCSIGQYVAFVDDDDNISDDYVKELINAIVNNSGVDVITFKQSCFIENNPKSIVLFSLNHENEPYIPNGIFKRKPYHVCAWRGDLARKYNFPSSNYGEDLSWVWNLWEEAKTEFFIDKILHAYIHSNSESEANVAHARNQQV